MKVCIIGGGMAGLMAAYRLAKNSKHSNIQIDILEKGNTLKDRHCPILDKKTNRCIKCKNGCSIMSGLAGAGAYSDGKYNITAEFGGWLQDSIDHDTLIEAETIANKVLNSHANVFVDEGEILTYQSNNEIDKLCAQNGLTLLHSKCQHFGTDINYLMMDKFIRNLDMYDEINFFTNATVTEVNYNDSTHKVDVDFNINDTAYHYPSYDKCIFAVGRSGSHFFSNWCDNHFVPKYNNQVDIGVRVELPSIIWDNIDSVLYDPKILYRTKQYGDTCRMFCHNPHGAVVNENTEGIITVNGHAYSNHGHRSDSTNFALLSTINFTEPFNAPIEYARDIAALANKISGGSVIIQSLGDLENGRRSTPSRLKSCRTKQTLTTAVAGDLSLCLPKRQLDNIIETLYALDKIAPGTANYDTLLYGVECKYYSARPKVNNKFEVEAERDKPEIRNIYAIGDGAGFTRSLAQAAAHGLIVADYIIQDMKDNEA